MNYPDSKELLPSVDYSREIYYHSVLFQYKGHPKEDWELNFLNFKLKYFIEISFMSENLKFFGFLLVNMLKE